MHNLLTAAQLKEKDPRLFEKEYYSWLGYAADYGWWEYHTDAFEKEMQEKYDMYVDSVDFEENYGWRVAAKGTIKLHLLMEHLGLKEKYLPLWYDAANYGAVVSFGSGRIGVTQRVSGIDYTPGNCYPDGVFKGMDQEAWDELVAEQFDAEDWEELALKWIEPHVDELAKQLEQEYEYATSEEEFLASCEANEVTFEVEGDDDAEI